MTTVAVFPEAKACFVARRFVGGSRDGQVIRVLPRRYEVTLVTRAAPFVEETYRLRKYALRSATYDAEWTVFRLDGMDDAEVRRRIVTTISPILHWNVKG